MVFSGIVPDGGNVVIHSGSHKNKQQGGSSYNLTGSGHMRPNAPATSGLIGVGRPPVASSGQTSTGAELQELERLKRKLRDQQTRLVSHMSSNSSSNNAAGSSSATPSRHNTPRSLPSITRTPNSTGPPLGGRSTPQHPRPPSSGGSPGINTGSPAIMPRPPSASSVPAMPRVAASQVRLASLLSPSVAPMDTPRFSRHAIDDDEEVSSLLRGIRLSEERMEQRKQIMTLDWARHPEEPRSPSQLAGLSMSDAGDADDLPPMVQVDMQDIGTVSMQGVLSSWASHRDGSVLNAQTILRRDRDEFLTGPPSGQQADKVDTMVLSACPLFRIADSLNVAAVGQPSIVGIRTLLNELRFQGKPRCVWINVREESFIYINGFSHTLCTSHPPFDNVRQRGIRRERLEAVESRLRDDILEEATRHEGNLALHYADHGKAVWEAIGGARDVSTPVEVFTELVPNIVYHRLPIGPKSSPPVETFDELIEIALRHPNDVIMFNCHSGRGRSTTAMMVVGLLRSYTHSNTFTADDLKKILHGQPRRLQVPRAASAARAVPRGVRLRGAHCVHRRHVRRCRGHAARQDRPAAGVDRHGGVPARPRALGALLHTRGARGLFRRALRQRQPARRRGGQDGHELRDVVGEARGGAHGAAGRLRLDRGERCARQHRGAGRARGRDDAARRQPQGRRAGTPHGAPGRGRARVCGAVARSCRRRRLAAPRARTSHPHLLRLGDDAGVNRRPHHVPR
eukprot:PhM_4_TR1995/c0_g1_i1/m.8967